MLDLNLLRTFVTVCEAGSVTDAAARLGQPKSTVSRHLARLEEELAHALVDRSRTGVSLTPEGKRLFEQTRDSIHLLAPLDRRERAMERSGRVRVQSPRYFARGPLSPVIRAFMAEAPDVTIECHSENRLADAAEDMDVVVTVGSQRSDGGEEWPLGPVSVRLYAAPGMFAPDPPPATLSALARHPFLSMCGTAGIPERVTFSDDHGNVSAISLRIRFATNDIDVLLETARDGFGCVQLPEFVGAVEVSAARLVPVLPELWTDRFMVSLSLTSGKRNPAARAFANFAVDRLLRGERGC